MHRSLYLVCYDVSCSTRRRALRRLLSAYRVEGQKSAFECLFTAAELATTISEIESLIDVSSDRLHVLRLDPRMPCECFGRAHSHAPARPLMVV